MQLMQQKVQKSRMTSLPRKSARVSGAATLNQARPGWSKSGARTMPVIAPPHRLLSLPLIRVHGEGAIGRAGMDAAALRPAGGAERGEEGQEMLLARMVALRVGGAPAIVDEIVAAPILDRRC